MIAEEVEHSADPPRVAIVIDRLVRAGPTLIAAMAVGVGVYLVVDGALGLAGR